MEPLDLIKSYIADFAGYGSEENRRLADEQIRAFVGERLAALPPVEVEKLSAEERERYERVLLRCEFANQAAFTTFAHVAPEPRVMQTLSADAQVLQSAAQLPADSADGLNAALERLDQAFDRRDSAMQA